jgi:hypothetical protein
MDIKLVRLPTGTNRALEIAAFRLNMTAEELCREVVLDALDLAAREPLYWLMGVSTPMDHTLDERAD